MSLINDDIYSSSVQLLPLGDVELMLAALDALYHMSKLGEETCTKIMMVSGSIGKLRSELKIRWTNFELYRLFVHINQALCAQTQSPFSVLVCNSLSDR